MHYVIARFYGKCHKNTPKLSFNGSAANKSHSNQEGANCTSLLQLNIRKADLIAPEVLHLSPPATLSLSLSQKTNKQVIK